MAAIANIKAAVKAGESMEDSQYLTFLLGREMFAIRILHIKEILEYTQPTTVPMIPSFIRGVINLRGSVVPVVDLSARFGREQSEITKRSCIVIVEVAAADGRQEIGMVVDAVSAVLEIPKHEIEPPPEFGAQIRTAFIHGMGKIDGKFVIILNVDKVLSVEDLSLASQAGQMAMAE